MDPFLLLLNVFTILSVMLIGFFAQKPHPPPPRNPRTITVSSTGSDQFTWQVRYLLCLTSTLLTGFFWNQFSPCLSGFTHAKLNSHDCSPMPSMWLVSSQTSLYECSAGHFRPRDKFNSSVCRCNHPSGRPCTSPGHYTPWSLLEM